jgi:hypothetical protein
MSENPLLNAQVNIFSTSLRKNLEKFEGQTITPESLRATVEEAMRAIEPPQIRVLGSKMEDNVLTVEVEVPVHLRHLIDESSGKDKR